MKVEALDIDLIIPTYNRKEKCKTLVQQVIQSKYQPQNIIIVDSSDEDNSAFFKRISPKVIAVKSSHKNQPYQRFLGYQYAQSKILVYLDDDMELIEQDAFKQIAASFETHQNTVGLALAFKNHNEFLQKKTIKSPILKLEKKIKPLATAIRFFTGYPQLKPGQYWLCGLRGKFPEHLENIEYLSGGAFAAKREFLFQNFNFQLYDLYEKKLGKGEDGILGYTLSKLGEIKYFKQELFYHNDQGNSVYSANLRSFNKRVTSSRLFLSKEYLRQNDQPTFFAYLHYYWYFLWRLGSTCINYLLVPSKSKKEKVIGTYQGIRSTQKLVYPTKDKAKLYWKTESQADLKMNNSILKDVM